MIYYRTSGQAVREKRLKRHAFRALAVCILFSSEITVSAAAGALAAWVFIPFAYASRGYWAIGGEWTLIALAAVIAYHFYHNWLFDKLENKPKRRNCHERKYHQ